MDWYTVCFVGGIVVGAIAVIGVRRTARALRFWCSWQRAPWRKVGIWVASLAIAAMGHYPPWKLTLPASFFSQQEPPQQGPPPPTLPADFDFQSTTVLGGSQLTYTMYGWIFDPPHCPPWWRGNYVGWNAQLDIPRLLVQCAAVAMLAGTAALMSQRR